MKKGILILTFLILALFSVSCVCAADVDDAIAISEDTAAMELAQSDEMTASDDSNVMEQSDDEELILEDNDVDKPMLGEGASTGSFTDLNDLINIQYYSNDTITLSCNYTFNGTDDDDSGFIHGIGINRGVTIDGKGCTIDGSQKARIFNIGNGGAVKFLNINFINGKATGSGYEGHGGAIVAPSYNCVVECCNFTNNTADDQGGALMRVTAYNCTFTGNTADSGGAIIGGSAYNCTFTGNTAIEGDGGAINSGSAYNSIFTGNTANDDGGAINGGSAYNCTFTGNTAIEGDGGAIYWGSAYNCTFTGNTAKHDGGAMMGNQYNPEEEFSATLCMFDSNNPNDYSYISIVKAVLSADDLTTSYKSGDRLLFNLTADNTNYVGFNTTIKIYQDGQEIGTYYALSGEGWIVDLSPGTYKAVLSLDKYEGVTNGTATITITDGTTFTDLNKAINDNTNDTITLDRNYAFNSTFDSAFTDGIVINRQVTINGNGHTIDAQGKARVFDVQASDVTIKNLTIKNAHGYIGGAIYWDDEWGSVVDCTFINNTATDYGGAIYWNENDGSISYCTFINNTAGVYGGAIYWNDDDGSISYCTFINNAAMDYYSGAISSNKYLLADYCWFGNTAKNYDRQPIVDSKVICTYWLFLNATSNPDTISVFDTSHVIFKLCIYNSNSGNFIEYDNSPFENLNLSIAATNGLADSVAKLGDVIKYNATCMGTGRITASFETVEYAIEITNLGLDSNLSFGPQKVNYASSTMIALDYNDLATGTVNITLKGKNGNNYTFTDLTLNATILLPEAINADEYEVNVTYSGDNAFWNATANGTLTVNKLKTELTASAVTTTYNINKDLVITLKDSTGKALSGFKVTVDLNGAKTYTTDSNGQVKVSTKGLAPKAYTAKITFNGNTNYAESTKDVKVTVKKATPKLTAKKKTFKSSVKTKKYTVTLKDNTGKAIKKAKVTLKVKGKTYKATTNSKGKATFKIKKLNKKGTFKATVTYKGDKYYNKVSKKAKIKVIVTFKTVSKGSKDKSTVKEIQQALKDHGYYLSYKGHYLKIDGKFKGCTERSVKEFQKDKHLKVTGKVDEKTAKKLGILS